MDPATDLLLPTSSRYLHPQWIVMILLFSIPIVAIVAHYWHRTIKTRSETELKRQMVEQGMSADEIERVLAAGSSDSACGRKKRASKDAAGKL